MSDDTPADPMLALICAGEEQFIDRGARREAFDAAGWMAAVIATCTVVGVVIVQVAIFGGILVATDLIFANWPQSI